MTENVAWQSVEENVPRRWRTASRTVANSFEWMFSENRFRENSVNPEMRETFGYLVQKES